jgi:hypothetical protein
MADDKQQALSLEECQARLAERLAGPIPRAKPKPKPEPLFREVADDAAAQNRRVRTQTVRLNPNDPNWRGSNSVVVKVLERPDDWDRPYVVSEYNPYSRM